MAQTVVEDEDAGHEVVATEPEYFG
jgi:hypothetical protein